jgi:predicted secreted hydrolase
VNPRRRAWLQAGLAAWAAPLPAARAAAAVDDDDRIAAGRALAFPRDHGAHPGARIEWWYATGWLQAPGGPLYGFQLTFFRSRTGLAEALPGRFAPRQLLFAHAAVTDVAARRHRHAQRIARWSGDEALPEAHAARADTAIALGRWTLQRDAASGAYAALLAAPEAGFTLDLRLAPSQPLLLQGDAGYSRKGPLLQQASHYYSQPQLAVAGALALDGQVQPVRGRAWLDHEWSDSLLDPQAVGWDWIGMNLQDGGALTVFRLRRADGSSLYAGGSFRAPGAATRSFGADELRMTPGRTWASTQSRATYPVAWRIESPVGNFSVTALLDNQELAGDSSTGTIYWEGLSELRDDAGRRLGLGYLEMTGYSGRLVL